MPHQGTRRDSTPPQIFVRPPHTAWLMEGGVRRDCCVIPSQKEAEMFPGCLSVSTEKGDHHPLRQSEFGSSKSIVPPSPMSQGESTHCAKSLSSCPRQIPLPWRSWGQPRDCVLFHTCWHDGPRDEPASAGSDSLETALPSLHRATLSEPALDPIKTFLSFLKKVKYSLE